MSNIINNLAEGAFALTIVCLFIAFIWSRIAKKSLGEVYDDITNWMSGNKTTITGGNKIKQVWNEKRTRM